VRASRVLAVLVAGALLTGCGDEGYHPVGPFRPLPENAPPEVGPPTSQAPVPGDPAQPGSGDEAGDPNVVASGLEVPTGLVVLPDGSAIVGERESGRLLQVFPDRSPARELMTVPGVDTAGDGGLLGLALSPTFLEDGLLYAYHSTATDNRVVRFPLGGTPNPVLTGIPRGETGNGGGLLFGVDGTLFVGTGDAGNPALAGDPNSLAGKVLRIDTFGRPAGGSSPVFSRGHRDVTALCQSGSLTGGQTGLAALYATDATSDGPDELNAIMAGADYGSPRGTSPVAQVAAEEGGLGGCAAVPGGVFLGALDGQRVHALTIDGNGSVTGDPEDFLAGRYGRLRTVVLDLEGALWITTSNRDGVGTPGPDDDRVLRIVPPTTAGSSPL
jgi:glucose/arabinose dehydrogenase